jgi:hypothetical protein
MTTSKPNISDSTFIMADPDGDIHSLTPTEQKQAFIIFFAAVFSGVLLGSIVGLYFN